jgi:UDP-glucose 4-epimerase
MRKVLVFGGSGFLGNYLVEQLVLKKYDVTVADIKQTNLNVDYIKCDILNDDNLINVFKKKYDIVYNLAGFANLEDAINEPILAMKLNLIANMKIAELCIKYNVEKYVFASSAYAMSEKGSFYGISKLASEKSIEEYNKKKGLNFIIIRYGSVYSEKPFKNNYIFNLVKESISSGKINHNGDGNEYREYIHAIDAAKLSVDVIESDEYLNNHVVLTGSQGIKRIDLFNMINEILGDTLKININEDNKSNHYKFTPYSFQASISKKLFPNPQIDLGQGILETIRSINESK